MTEVPPSYRRQAFEAIDSTNKYVLEAARRNVAGQLWVTAQEQTDGRGRRGRAWSSPKGNLSASLLLINPAPAQLVGQLPLVTATAVHRAVCDVVPPHIRSEISIKWPNDVLWGNQKICGILLESATLKDGRQAVGIGIGINCKAHPDKTDGLAAANLSQSGFEVDSEVMFERLAHHMAERLECWQSGANFVSIREDWVARARGIGLRITARLPDVELEGIFENLDESGALLLKLDNGERRVIYAGDVFLPGMRVRNQ